MQFFTSSVKPLSLSSDSLNLPLVFLCVCVCACALFTVILPGDAAQSGDVGDAVWSAVALLFSATRLFGPSRTSDTYQPPSYRTQTLPLPGGFRSQTTISTFVVSQHPQKQHKHTQSPINQIETSMIWSWSIQTCLVDFLVPL